MKGGGAYAKTPIQIFLIQTLVIDVLHLQGPQMHSIQFSYYLNSIQFVKKDLVKKITFLIRKRHTRIFYQYIYLRGLLKRELKIFILPIWDGRIRTFEYWDQNLLPYHLATPHFNFNLVLIKSATSIGCSSISIQSPKIILNSSFSVRILTRVGVKYNLIYIEFN